jgi:CheY-like chemotaxis protein
MSFGRGAADHAAVQGALDGETRGQSVCPMGGSKLHLLLSYAGWQPDPWIERLPRLLEPMGVTSHVASTGKQASDLISKTKIHVAVVDLGLPLDGSGAESAMTEFSEGGPRLLELLSRLSEPPPVVAVKRSRTHRDDSREIAAALRLGAFAVIDRPHDAGGLNRMLEVLRRCLVRHYKGCWPESQPPRGGND